MKNINVYIKEGLADWGEDKTLNKKISKQTTKTAIKQEITDWIIANTHYSICKTKLKFDFNTSPVTVNYTGIIKFKYEINSLTNGLFQWGYVGPRFECDYTKITSLEGAPREVNDFNCSYCEFLESLEGAPDKCKYFNCRGCMSLTSLEGSPEECDVFRCGECESLTTLKGAPKKVRDFHCEHCSNITSLKGAPKEVEKNFDCSFCKKLESLEGAPKKVGKNFRCSNCKTSFTVNDVKKVSKVSEDIIY
jgi:hypothetical protein